MKSTAYKLSLILCVLSLSVAAQDESFIYGKVYMHNDRVYEGPIRWGKEEAYWVDVFNSGKEKNSNLRYLSDRERDDLASRQNDWGYWTGGFMDRWFGWSSSGNTYRNDFTHQFACQFGELKSLEPSGRKYVEVEMKNGDKFTVLGEGYNDIGEEIRIMDPEMGQVDIDWNRIRKIEFMKTPKNLANKFGKPLYGTVEAYGEKFTGFVQWDHDERLSIDKLDGDTDDGDLSIEFGKIQSIERRGGSSLVVLKSGRELRMTGSNDVSSGHRGVIVMNKDFVSVDIPWNEFDKVTFSESIPGPLSTYDEYSSQKQLTGEVTTREGKTLTGRIVYDLDEEYDYELLQGKKGDYKFSIALRSVKQIEQVSEYRCVVELRSGAKLSLDDEQDVNERNQGVLVFAKENQEPVYIPWSEVKLIAFK